MDPVHIAYQNRPNELDSVQPYDSKTQAQIMLKALVGNVFDATPCNSNIEDISCDDRIHNVWTAIKQGVDSATTENVIINLKENGSYFLCDADGSLLLKTNDARGHELARFELVTLDEFKQKFNKLVQQKELQNWEIINPKKETGKKAVETVEEGFAYLTNETITVPIEQTFPAYLTEQNIGMTASAVLTEIDLFLNFKKIRQHDSFGGPLDLKTHVYQFGELTLHPLIEGQTAALQFVKEHKNEKKMTIVPYVAVKRVVGEDHIVLLAMKDGKSGIIDSKLGWFLGFELWARTNKTYGLDWQATLDKTTCGFFLYHIVTTLISAFQDGKAGHIKSVDDFVKDIQKMQKPMPEKIQQQMRDIRIALDRSKEEVSNQSQNHWI